MHNTNREKITYDANWNIIKYESGGSYITYSYDQNGNLSRREYKMTGATTSASSIITEYSYDDKNLCISNTTKQEVKDNKNQTNTKTTSKKYDIKYELDTNGYPTRRINYYDGKEESKYLLEMQIIK